MDPVIKVIEVGSNGVASDKSGAAIPKVRATDTLTPQEVEALIKQRQKPKPGAP